MKPEVEHLVGLVEDDVAGGGEDERAALDQVLHPADGGDDDVRLGADAGGLVADRGAAEDGDDVDVEVLGVGAQRLRDLDAELAGRGQDDRLGLVARRDRGTGAAAGRRRRSCRCRSAPGRSCRGRRAARGSPAPGSATGSRSRARRARCRMSSLRPRSRKVTSHPPSVAQSVRRPFVRVIGWDRAGACPASRDRQRLVRLGDLGEPVRAADHDLELPRGDSVEQLADAALEQVGAAGAGGRARSRRPRGWFASASGSAPRSAPARRSRR